MAEHRGGTMVCPSCGRADNLSQFYCVHCGTDMQPAVAKLVTRATGSDTRPTGLPARPTAGDERVAAAPARPYKPPKFYTPLATGLGIVAGVLLAYLAVGQGVDRLAVQSHWPAHGLVIYASPPDASVVIAERAGKNFTVGRTGPSGTLSLADLPAGHYRITLSAPGRIPVVKDIQVEANRPAVLGFPTRIDLPPER